LGNRQPVNSPQTIIGANSAGFTAVEAASTLGQIIRDARQAHGLTQADLAARAHVAQAYLSYLERDQREPSLSIAARIARELEIPLDELASAVRIPLMASRS
jgi:ribosome-binding protein aMBF1 (putative translation factor)